MVESAPNLRFTADGAHYIVFLRATREIRSFPSSTSSTSHRIRNEPGAFMNEFVEISLIYHLTHSYAIDYDNDTQSGLGIGFSESTGG